MGKKKEPEAALSAFEKKEQERVKKPRLLNTSDNDDHAWINLNMLAMFICGASTRTQNV